MASTKAWIQMAVVGVGLIVGGPALVNYVRPTEEELFKRFNPDLQKRNLANREQRAKDFDDYVLKLKEYSKSDKNIWVALKEAEEEQKEKEEKRQQQQQEQEQAENKNAPVQ